jgi:hypothetical protein
MIFDYHRKTNTAMELYKSLEQIPREDLFIIWDYMTSTQLTEEEKQRYKYLTEVKYDLIRDLQSREISPFVKKYLFIKFGSKNS